ncbi:MAG: TonB-dependent receptor [Bacteroidaceae bacterium]|nr:TonB-dependent receptor [Bacteroidaceae bacterium]
MKVLRKCVSFVLAAVLPLCASAQNVTVKGKVIDATGEPMASVSVAQVGTTNGTATDFDGNYSLSVPSNATLQFSFIGYATQTVAVNGKSVINVTLEEDSELLEDVVIIGYGAQKKANVTGSIASMGGDNLREVAAADFSRALAGRVAGVTMTQTSSRPGESMEIRIRGQRSLTASNDPLIVLDGVPFMGSLSDISPNDIKSMDILKDAASTAIYGSRGANGVIMITTYKGVQGEDAQISFNNYMGFKKAIKFPMMSGSDYVAMRAAAGKFTNSADENDSYDNDWQDSYYRTGVVRNHELSVKGGTKSGSYRFGLGYYKDEAVIPTQDYDRISLNGSVDQTVAKYFKIGFSTNTNYNRNHGNQLGMYDILQLSPILTADKERAQMPLDNVYVLTKDRLETLTDKWVNERSGFGSYNTGYLQVELPWVKGLTFKETVGLNYRNNESGSFTGKGVNNYDSAAPNSANSSTNQTLNWSVENLLTYDRTFNNVHHVNAVAMYSAEQTTYRQSGLSAKNIPNEQFLYYNIGRANAEDITVSPNSFNYWQAGLTSWMGRLMYSYADKYMISAAIRQDASSRLAKGHQTHTYPAISAGWNLGEEDFMRGISWMDELKLRVGYGETSNQAISPYQTLGSLGTMVYNFGDTYATGYYVSTLPNDNLGWEYSTTWNYGIDFTLFKGRLSGSAEYYVQQTHDILLSLSLPSTAGVGSYTGNIGSTENKGFEFSVNGTIIQNKDWQWDMGVNFYVNHNKLTSLASGSDDDKANHWFVGMPINCIYDYEYDGLWQAGDAYMDILEPGAQPGDIKVKYHGEYDAEGKPVRAIDSNDMVPTNADPKFQGGFNTRLAWKNLDLSVMGSFQYGGILISTLHSSSGYLNMLTGRRGQIDVDYWTPENTDARYPRPGGLLSGDNPKYGSTLGYFDGSYLKVSNITLGYNFDQIKALKDFGISRLRLYATAQNPFVISAYTRECGLDPEPNARGNEFQASAGYLSTQRVIGTNTPNTHNFIFGLNLTF